VAEWTSEFLGSEGNGAYRNCGYQRHIFRIVSRNNKEVLDVSPTRFRINDRHVGTEVGEIVCPIRRISRNAASLCRGDRSRSHEALAHAALVPGRSRALQTWQDMIPRPPGALNCRDPLGLVIVGHGKA
jgi:hypothetical protein